MKIRRIRIYQPIKLNPIYNQSDMIVTIETDEGLVGIGEGGAPDTLKQCAGMLIGEDPGRTEHLWQMMYRGYFYPAGREKLHALGALDLALWDIKGKKLGVPVYQLIGGKSRDYVECYSTGYPWNGSFNETAAACVENGFRAYRTSVAESKDGIFDVRRMVEKTVEQCRQIKDGVGNRGDWAIDYHTRLDIPEAVRLSGMLEELAPMFIEDPLRSENPGALEVFRSHVKVPIAVGEQFGDRWDVNELVEKQLIDYTRVTLPNVGGITEWLKIAAICETHYVGMIPHFTGPVALAALVHTLGASSLQVLQEVTGAGPGLPEHLKKAFNFNKGKLWLDDAPGLGIELDYTKLELTEEISQPNKPIPMFRRPDGSFTNW